MFKFISKRSIITLLTASLLSLSALPNVAQAYALKIYKVESALYPFVQVYFRTFDDHQQPLVNLNELNVGLMVKGKSYDLAKKQYRIESIRHRNEAIRTVLVLDTSGSMAGRPFTAALRAVGTYFQAKRPQDEIAVIAIDSRSTNGFTVVSEFERDKDALARRVLDIQPISRQSRIYDSIGAAMKKCGMSAQGSELPKPDNYIISCSIVVFSDGRDQGSALSREELNARITSLNIPIPIYSLAYTRNRRDFRNLESLSTNSFGIYYPIGESVDNMVPTVEQIQNILQSDYVLTFRSYLKVDGEEHAIKVGVEYPSGSGKFTYEGAKMEAVELPIDKKNTPDLVDKMQKLNELIPELSSEDGKDKEQAPYFKAIQPPTSTTPAQP